MLTNADDFVIDPFAGSCVTGEVCERLQRTWLCIELAEEYVRGALGRFKGATQKGGPRSDEKRASEPTSYKVFQPGYGWNGLAGTELPQDGGRKRGSKPK